MKVRAGHVSNSSSSSFVFCRTLMSEEQQKELDEVIKEIESATVWPDNKEWTRINCYEAPYDESQMVEKFYGSLPSTHVFEVDQ